MSVNVKYIFLQSKYPPFTISLLLLNLVFTDVVRVYYQKQNWELTITESQEYCLLIVIKFYDLSVIHDMPIFFFFLGKHLKNLLITWFIIKFLSLKNNYQRYSRTLLNSPELILISFVNFLQIHYEIVTYKYTEEINSKKITKSLYPWVEKYVFKIVCYCRVNITNLF